MPQTAQFCWWIYCRDCLVYMELGKYNHSEGRFDGPTLVDGTVPQSDWALRRFLEVHRDHRVGLVNDEEDMVENRLQYEDMVKTIPESVWCMKFKTEDDLFDDVQYPLSAERDEPSEKRIAVSVLTLKRPWFLLQCLTALMKNDVQFTLFLTNQGDMTKGTQMVCDWWKNRPYVEYIYNDPPLFPGAARAKVFKKASADGFEYIITVDDDSCLEPHAIDKIVETADSHPEYHAISGWFINRVEKYLLGGRIHPVTRQHTNYGYEPGLHEADYISNGFRLIRLEPLVLPDTNYTVGYTDWDYAEQLRSLGLRMATTGDAGGYHKHLKNSKGEMVPAKNPLKYRVRSRTRLMETREYFESKWGYYPD